MNGDRLFLKQLLANVNMLPRAACDMKTEPHLSSTTDLPLL